MNPKFIGIAGNIGVGKTTFTQILGEHFGFEEYYESVVDNPYLEDFYNDMNRWSFNLQIYFLHHRFAGHIEMSKNTIDVIQDRTIYEDVEIFAKNLYHMGYMSKRDWNTYSELFNNMVKFIKKPDLIIYLKADINILINRIKNRNRDFEKKIDSEYLYRLNLAYDKWINSIIDIPLLIVDTNELNVFMDTEELNQIFQRIKDKLYDRK